MAEQKVKRPFAARTLQGCTTSLLLRILVMPAVLCCVLAWLAGAIRLINQTYGTEMEALGVVGAGLSGICVFVLLPLAVTYGIIWQQRQRLDTLFTPLGLTGSTYAVRWRQYRGIVGGREMTAKVSRGLTVNLILAATLGTRMGIGARTGLGVTLSGFAKEHLLELDDPDFVHLAASAHDKEWARG